MNLLKSGVVLAFALVASIAVLAVFSYIQDDTSESDLIMEEGMRTFKEERCVDGKEGITCVEYNYLQKDADSAPELTSYVIKERVFVPKYIEKEKIIVEEKKANGEEKQSPADRIKDSDINVFSNSIRVDIKNAKWRYYIDSNSMDPLIDEGTTTIEIKPKNADEIKVGDIIAYNVEGYDYALVHRVVEKGNDENGVYFVTKGDNFWQEDHEKVRFSDIEGVVVGVLY